MQKSESQLRSKRYKVKLSEIMLVPFGSNTVKEVPEIVFSQEMTPLHGFPVSDERKKENGGSDCTKQMKTRDELIKSLEREIQSERKRGRPPKKKYPENEVTIPDDFLDENEEEEGGSSLFKVKKIEVIKKRPPSHGFDYAAWLDILDLDIFKPKSRGKEQEDDANYSEESDVGPNDVYESEQCKSDNINNTAPQSENEELDSNSSTFSQFCDSLNRQRDDFETRRLQGLPIADSNQFEGMEADVELMREETSDAEQDIYGGNEIVSEENESHEDTNEQIRAVAQFQLNQERKPRKSDKVLFYSEQKESWQVIVITSHVIQRSPKSGLCYNFRYDDDSEDGAFFKLGELWGILDKEAPPPDLQILPTQLNVVYNTIDQVDGAVTPDSLTPVESPESSLNHKEFEDAEFPDESMEQFTPRQVRQARRSKQQEEYEREKLILRPRGYRLRSSTAFDILDEYIDEEYSDQVPVFEEDTDDDYIESLMNNAQLAEEYSGTFHRCPLLREHDPIVQGQVYQLPIQQASSNNVEEPPEVNETHDDE